MHLVRRRHCRQQPAQQAQLRAEQRGAQRGRLREALRGGVGAAGRARHTIRQAAVVGAAAASAGAVQHAGLPGQGRRTARRARERRQSIAERVTPRRPWPQHLPRGGSRCSSLHVRG